MNRRNLTFKLKPNSFADMTDAEYDLHKGSLPDHPMEIKMEKKRIFFYINETYKPHKKSPRIPDKLDWREYGTT